MVAILMQCTSESLIIEEFRGSTGSDLIQRTSRSLIFEAVHEQELDATVLA